MLEQLKQAVFEANLELVEKKLVIYTWGNVSGIDRDRNLVVIKPSGVPYEKLRAEHMVILGPGRQPGRRKLAAFIGYAHSPGLVSEF